MKNSYILLFCAAMTALSSSAFAQVRGAFTPEQVYSVFYSDLRAHLQMRNTGESPYWLSLSLVGKAISKDDQVSINNIANFAPPASPVIEAFTFEPGLAATYENILGGMIGPFREHTESYKKARALLVGDDGKATPAYATYNTLRKDFEAARIAVLGAKTDEDRTKFQSEQSEARERWEVFGHKGDIDQAWATMEAEDSLFGASRSRRRIENLHAFQAAAQKLAAKQAGEVEIPAVGGGFVAPLSYLSPAPENWDKPDGWAHFEFSASDVQTKYSASSSQKMGFVGLSFGGGFLGIKKGGGSGDESSVKTVKSFGYKVTLKRVSIERPWLDRTVLFDPLAWTWRKSTSGGQYPLVATARTADGIPQDSKVRIYENQAVSFAVLPVELIIGKDVSLTATVSKEDYQKIVKEHTSGGGGSFFGLFGGSKSKTTLTEIATDNQNTTFTVTLDGTAVIGLISQILPELPTPNRSATWGPDAWLPAENSQRL